MRNVFKSLFDHWPSLPFVLFGAGSYILGGTVLDQTRAGLENELTTNGGVLINENAEVLDESHAPIPGLYLCGADADGFCGETYGVNLPGSTQSFGMTYGMIAAESACEFIKR